MTNQDPHRQDSDEVFGRAAGELLRQGAETIDAATASRLNQARQAALAQMPGRRARPPWLVPALTAAAVGVVAVGLALSGRDVPGGSASPVPALESAADMDLLLEDDSLEMLENLEFYAWMDADLSPAELGAELESTG
jgi:hypothetical protein